MLLLDENISHRIITSLAPSFPGIKHIKDIATAGTADDAVWKAAIDNNLTIVTFDADYENMLTLRGFPPKVIWFRFGNSINKVIIDTLLFHEVTIKDFIKNKSLGILEINEAIQ
jgi:predicted nuclease of predicted toxin-antitoxin system